MPALYYYPDADADQLLHVVALPALSYIHRFTLPSGEDGESLTGKPSSDRRAPEERVRLTLEERMSHTNGVGNSTYEQLHAFVSHLRRGATGLFALAEDETTMWAGETTTTVQQGDALAVVPDRVYSWMSGTPLAGETTVVQSLGATSEAMAERLDIDSIAGGGATLNFGRNFRYTQDETPVLIRELGTHIGLYLRAEDFSEGVLVPINSGLGFRFDVLARVSRYAIRQHLDHAPLAFADSIGTAGATFQSVL